VNLDLLNKLLGASASFALIVGVVVAIVGVFVATQTLRETQKAESATLVLRLQDTIDDDRYAKIADDIRDNGPAHVLLKDRGGKFRDIDVEGYIGNFEDIGYLVQEHVVVENMAYHHFAYDVEKAWCNADVQRVVRDARKADKSITAASDPIYGNFERLAETYLARERQTCNDLANL
jgi:hypothetical protein